MFKCQFNLSVPCHLKFLKAAKYWNKFQGTTKHVSTRYQPRNRHHAVRWANFRDGNCQDGRRRWLGDCSRLVRSELPTISSSARTGRVELLGTLQICKRTFPCWFWINLLLIFIGQTLTFLFFMIQNWMLFYSKQRRRWLLYNTIQFYVDRSKKYFSACSVN